MSSTVKCRNCKEKFEKDFDHCPHCGAENKKGGGGVFIFLLILIALGVGAYIIVGGG